MPWNEVPGKWKSGTLHSGSATGPKVKSHAQMVAIMLDEKRRAASHPEYQANAAVRHQMKQRMQHG